MNQIKALLLCASALTIIPTASALAAEAPSTPAQPAAASADKGIEVLTVTAQKRVENIQDVPLSISAVSDKTLVARGVHDVAGLQKLVPSLRIDNTAQSAGLTLRIRGIGAGSNAAIDPSVAAYIDGIYMPRPGVMLSSFLDVAGVEVLRGPQGTLFGRNATVGAISIRTADPSFVRNSGQFSLEGGSFGHVKVQGIGNMAVSDKLAVRVAGFEDRQGGWIDDKLGGKVTGRSNTLAGRVSVKAQVTPDLVWTGRADYASTTGDGINLTQVDTATASAAQLTAFRARSGLSAAQIPGPSYDAYQRFDQPDLNDRQWGLTSDLVWTTQGGYALKLIDSYRSWRNHQTDGDVVFTPLDMLNRHGAFSSDSQSHELQFLTPKLFGGRVDFVAGLYYFGENYDTLEVFDVGSNFCGFVYGVVKPALIPACQASAKTNATNGAFHQKADSLAGYVQAKVEITPTVDLTLGGRYTHDSKSASFVQTANPFVGAGVFRAPETANLKFSENRPNWRASLSWKITPQVMAFATYSTGYKSGGFNNQGGAAALGASRVFDSETSKDYELGLKSAFLDRRILLNANIYQMDLDNFQDRSFNGLTFIIKNAGAVRARGVEIEGAVQPVDGLKFDLGVSYLDSIFASNKNAPGLPACTGAATSCPLVQDLTGRTTTYAPKWQVELGGEYTAPLFQSGWNGTLRGTLNHASKVFTTNDDNPQSITGGDTFYGARITFVSPDHNLSLALFGDNLSDVKSFTLKLPQTLDKFFGVQNPANGSTLMRGFMGQPRTFGARVTANF